MSAPASVALLPYIATANGTTPKIIEAAKARMAQAIGTNGALNTASTENVILKACRHFENGEINSAVATLCVHLENSAVKWSHVLDAAMMLLVDITLTTDRIAKLQRPFLIYQKVSSHEKISRIDFITTHVLARLEDIMAHADVSSNAASENTQFLNAVLPEASAIIKVGASSAIPAVSSFVSLYFRKYRFTFGNNNTSAYLSTMTRVLEFINRHKIASLVGGLSNSLRDFAKELFARSDSGATATLETAVKVHAAPVIATRLAILESAIILSQWQVVKFSLEEIGILYRTIEDAVKRVNRSNNNANLTAVQLYDSEVACRRFAAIADVFLKCENWLFHADALRSQYTFASQEVRATLATKAAIAALCTPTESDDADARVSSGFFEEQTPNMRLASIIGLTRVPTRESAIADSTDILAVADANAQVLFKMVTERKAVDIAVIYKHLEALRRCDTLAKCSEADADRYIAALERALLVFYMDTHFQSTPSLEFTTFDKVKLLYPKKNDLTALATTLAARVDMKARVANFNTAELKIRSCISSIGTKTSKMLAMPIKKRKVAISATALEAENTRLNNRISLSALCVNKSAERASNLAKKEQEEINQRQGEIQREELERHAKVRAAHLEIMKKKVEQAENVERRRKVVTIVANREPGIQIPHKVIEDGRNFLDRAAGILAQHRRDADTKRTVALREAHYLEKYIRDTERPKREEQERSMGEQYKKDSEARVENFKQQHRRNFEGQLALKERLNVYRERAAQYEAQSVAAAAAAVKTSKRDEQEDLLRAAKEALMAQME